MKANTISTPIPKTSFKNSIGVWLTKSLFFETADSSEHAIYTLKEEDHPRGYPSLKRLYLLECDPTEYRFATAHLGSWVHWENICQCTWFQPHLHQWRKELELKIRSEALANILLLSKQPSKEKFTASKFLVDRGWEGNTSSKGRPSKAEIRTAAKEISLEKDRLLQDAERLNLN